MLPNVPLKYQAKVINADAAAELIQSGMTVVTSGFSKLGYPKAVPSALARRGEHGAKGITLITSGAVGPEIDEWVQSRGVTRMLPYQSSRLIRNLANEGTLAYSDHHLGRVADWIRTGQFGAPDVALIEIAGFSKDGGLVPRFTIGNSATYINHAKHIILEVNISFDRDLYGLHDILDLPPFGARTCIPIFSPGDRAGSPDIQVDPDRVIAVVVSEQAEQGYTFSQSSPETAAIGKHVSDFIRSAKQDHNIPQSFAVQVGVGNLGNTILEELSNHLAPFSIFSEVVHDTVLAGLDEGAIQMASTGTLALSAKGQQEFMRHYERYRSNLIIRPQPITNHPEIIRRLGLVSVNSAVEVDIYGHTNSSAAMGSKLINGVGGSGDFTRNALLTIMALPSTRDNGRISTIVPMVSHVDHTEHEVQVVVTEQGVADLRGRSPRERAQLLIENCAAERFKEELTAYFTRACRYGGQWPHVLPEAFAWHIRYGETGDML